MKIYKVKSIDLFSGRQNLVRLWCLLVFTISLCASTTLRSQTFIFAPGFFNPSDPFSTNYHLGANWSTGYEPPNTLTSGMTLMILSTCRFQEGEILDLLLIKNGATIEIGQFTTFFVDARFYNMGSITGGLLELNRIEGPAVSTPVENMGTIDVSLLQLKRMKNTSNGKIRPLPSCKRGWKVGGT